MKFNLRHILLGISAIALGVVVWISITNFLDHHGDGLNTKQLETTLRSLNELDPESDVSGRIKTGDFRYVGCTGEPGGPFFPGIPQSEWQRIREEKNFWTLNGTSDAIESHHHHQLINRARVYAERFNIVMKSKRYPVK